MVVRWDMQEEWLTPWEDGSIAHTEEEYTRTLQRNQALESALQAHQGQMQGLQQNLDTAQGSVTRQRNAMHERDQQVQRLKTQLEEEGRKLLEANLLNTKLAADLEHARTSASTSLTQARERVRVLTQENDVLRTETHRVGEQLRGAEKKLLQLSAQLGDQAIQLSAATALASSRGAAVEELTNAVFGLKAHAGDLKSKLASQQALLDALEKPRNGPGTCASCVL